jgi:dTDP-4-dehydrorhamnose reductase
MTRVLVLGGTGLLGSMLVRYLSRNPRIAVASTARRSCDTVPATYQLAVDGDAVSQCRAILDDFPADYVVNCIGLTNVYCRDHDPFGVLNAVNVNACFPHDLAVCLASRHVSPRVIHVSTDCVFSGRSGSYDESSVTDPVDFYGKSKLLGEVQRASWLNIRCSFVGPAAGNRGLLEWLRKHSPGDTVQGFVNHHWSGVTTLQWARFCEKLVVDNGFEALRACGPVVHFAPNVATTKYELLCAINEIYALRLTVVPACEMPAIDRRLVSQFLDPPSGSIVDELAELHRFCRDA